VAFLIQNDSGSVSGANAYVTAAEFKAYHADRGADVAGEADADVQIAIIKATDYMDHRFRFRGDRSTVAQRTAWPRTLPEDDDQHARSGIPQEVKEACMDYALIALTSELNPIPTRDAAGAVVQSRSEQVGPVSESTSYVGGATFSEPRYPKADFKLRGLIEQSGYLVRG